MAPSTKAGSSGVTPVTSPPPAEADGDAPVAIGIDLGSEYCCVAYCKDGRGEVIANEDGERSTPSAVAFDDEERVRAAAEAGFGRASTATGSSDSFPRCRSAARSGSAVCRDSGQGTACPEQGQHRRRL